MQLYFSRHSVASTVGIALEEAGLEFEAVKVDFANGAQTKEPYTSLNPKARVPTLVHGENTMTEAGALLEYVADLAPDAGLRPSDPVQVARMREAMFYFASTMHVNHAHRQRGARWASLETSLDDMRKKVPENMAGCCAYVSEHMLQGPFVLGNQFSLADIYLYVICTWLQDDGVNLDDFPKIQDFIKMMESRASVRAVQERGMM
ncbi:glutathione S-transferase family protein [Epibacterium ulvae]|uniref:glutathione S-transferase family protein n=1 Tax=Epibacterium ulvae TaxID=1156985 RepID=UPI001BFCAF68|nr:glutathione S-transferase family protein [Epibacterium ulvae]MBT8155077.1 glutathione S-transferase family protein [Epibacterium ulvae]